MTWTETIKTPPTVNCVSVDELKAHSRITGNDLDAQCAAAIAAAERSVEDYLEVALVTQTRVRMYDTWARSMTLATPLVTVVRFLYLDDAGAEVVVPAEHWAWTLRGIHYTGGCMAQQGIVVEYVAGAEVAMISPAIQMAVKLLASHFLENTEAAQAGNVRELPLGVKDLLLPYKRFSI